MKFIRAATAACHLLILSSVTWAEGNLTAIEEIPVQKCNWPTVNMTAHFRNVSRQADMAKTVIPIMERIESLTSNGGKLNTQDTVSLNQAAQRYDSINANQILESNRARDYDVIDHLLQVADKNYRWSTEFAEGSSEFVYQKLVSLLPVISESPGVSLPSFQKCSAQVAIYRIEEEPIKKLGLILSNSNAEKILTKFKDIAKRNRMEQIDRAKLSAADLKTYDDLNNEYVFPADKESVFIKVLENIRYLAQASETIYEYGRQDLLNSGGDYKTVGKSLDAIIAAKELNPNLVTAVGFIRVIFNKEIPSEVQKVNATIGQILKGK